MEREGVRGGRIQEISSLVAIFISFYLFFVSSLCQLSLFSQDWSFGHHQTPQPFTRDPGRTQQVQQGRARTPSSREGVVDGLKTTPT